MISPVSKFSQEALRQFCLGLNKKFGVDVRIIHTDQAAVVRNKESGARTILLPALREYSLKDYYRLCRYALHETSHIRYNDWFMATDALRRSKLPQSREELALLLSCANNVIDISHHVAFRKEYEGFQWYHDMDDVSDLAQMKTAPEIRMILNLSLYYRWPDQSAKLGVKPHPDLLSIMASSGALRSTDHNILKKASIAIWQAVMRLMKQPKQQPPPPQPGNGQGGNGQPGDGKSDGNGGGKSAGQEAKEKRDGHGGGGDSAGDGDGDKKDGEDKGGNGGNKTIGSTLGNGDGDDGCKGEDGDSKTDDGNGDEKEGDHSESNGNAGKQDESEGEEEDGEDESEGDGADGEEGDGKDDAGDKESDGRDDAGDSKGEASSGIDADDKGAKNPDADETGVGGSGASGGDPAAPPRTLGRHEKQWADQFQMDFEDMALKKIGNDSQNEQGKGIASPDEVATIRPEYIYHERGAGCQDRIPADVRGAGILLASRIRTVLREVDATPYSRGGYDKGKRVSPIALSRYRTDGKIFSRRHEREEVSASVLIMCDLSGSMGSGALIDGYTGNPNQCRAKRAIDMMEMCYLALKDNREIELNILCFGSTMMMVDLSENALEAARRKALGGTATAEAMKIGMGILDRSKKIRKVGILITDGGSDSYERTNCMIEEWKNRHYKLITLMIDCRGHRENYPGVIHVDRDNLVGTTTNIVRLLAKNAQSL